MWDDIRIGNLEYLWKKLLYCFQRLCWTCLDFLWTLGFMNNYLFKAVLGLGAALSCIFCTASQADWWLLGGDWSVQLLPGRVAFLWHFGVGGKRERGCLLPFWIVESENKQSCLYFGLKLISLRLSLSFVLIDQTVSCWVFWECSGEERLRLGEPVMCHPDCLKNGEYPETDWESTGCVWNPFLYQALTSNFHGDGGVLDKLFFTRLQSPFSGHPQIDLAFANYSGI